MSARPSPPTGNAPYAKPMLRKIAHSRWTTWLGSVEIGHAKTAADAMLRKTLELWRDHQWLSLAETGHRELRIKNLDHASIKEITARLDGRRANQRTKSPSTKITEAVREQIEDEFTHRSDDGLLEHLASVHEDDPNSTRLAAVSSLAQRLLNGSLYKILGHAATVDDQAIAEQAYEKFAEDPQTRMDLERTAANFAGLDHGYDVVVWLPNPKCV